MKNLIAIKSLLFVASLQEKPCLAYGWISRPSFLNPTTQRGLKRRHCPAAATNPIHTDTNNQDTESLPLRELYPHWSVVQNGSLQVDDVHTLSFRVYGTNITTSNNEKKLVGLFLHGGPGAGCFPNHARFFDPQRYHQIVLLDQRGCGQSTPTACLIDNTLPNLVQDCETLKDHLSLPHWDVVLGGSWGTTLAISYAQTFPNSVKSLVLRGIFLLRNQEVDWLFSSSGGAAQRYPQQFEQFCQAVSITEPNCSENPRQALHEHYQRFWAAPNETIRQQAAQSWMQWEFFNSVAYKIPSGTNLTDRNATMRALQSYTLPPKPKVVVYSSNTQEWSVQSIQGIIMDDEEFDDDDDLPSPTNNESMIQDSFRQDISQGYSRDNPPLDSIPVTPNTPYYLGEDQTTNNTRLPVQAMLTCYYSTNSDWCRNYNHLLNNMEMLTNIPCFAIQGGSDGICPPDSALDFANEYPGWIELRMPVNAGHSMYDPLITNELVQATDRMADFLLENEQQQ